MAKLKEAVSFLGSIAKMHVISHHLSKSPDTWYVNRQDLTWFFTRKQIGGRGIYKKISSNPKPLIDNAELLIDFVSNKMNKSWMGLEKAPEGSFKNKLHGLGLRLLARVKPSEILLKSITKDVTNVQITYPTSLNARLVQQRLRQIALRLFNHQHVGILHCLTGPTAWSMTFLRYHCCVIENALMLDVKGQRISNTGL
ncbi:uncharacterized protein LOC120217765 isoform X4 [Hibiscus syriacus]|uniref:uncharacterized protein LOC120217765 isoform X4 n=1 Tax=Hibiscus syriacus TaxID=106335 RepID=UPI001921A8B1|nr:uncharacterized protein LOC120217765 isoform X4 [Hibiscus syriacus]